MLLHSYHHLHGMNAVVLRYFTVYGPGGRPDMSVFRFIRAIAEGDPVTMYGDGTQRRDFTYVDDIARGTVAALGLRGFQTINLGQRPPGVRERSDRDCRKRHRTIRTCSIPGAARCRPFADVG